MIIEDNTELRQYISQRLADRYEILEAAHGADGLSIAREHKPDLILSDVMMPGQDGMELCRVLKQDERTSHVPILLLTAKSKEESKLAGLALGADDYLVKPVSTAELRLRIHNLIATRRLLRERFGKQLYFQPAGIAVTPPDAAFLDRAHKVLDAHLANLRFGVDEFADAMALSSRQLQRKITALTGQGPAAFIKQYRLETAATLLRKEFGSIADVCYAVGFQNPKYFAKLFRKVHGLSPSQFAAKNRPASSVASARHADA